jgi:hypothetical protein
MMIVEGDIPQRDSEAVRLRRHIVVDLSVTSLNKNVTSVKQHKHLSMTSKAKDKRKPGFQSRSAITLFSCQYLLRKNMANDGLHKTCKKVVDCSQIGIDRYPRASDHLL